VFFTCPFYHEGCRKQIDKSQKNAGWINEAARGVISEETDQSQKAG
jgi:hypothetical protein